MKTLKITTHWTTEEADGIYRLLDDLQCAIWESYGQDIEQLYQPYREEQLERNIEREKETLPWGEIPF